MVLFLLSILVMLIFKQTVSDLVYYEKCHPNGKNAIAQAYNHFYPPMRSCKSSSIYDKKEVHVFRVYSSQTPYSTAIAGDHVKLYLEKISYDNMTVILVLSSDVDLTWNLVLPDQAKCNMVVWISENTILKNRKTMQFYDQRNFSRWLKNKFGVVSSHVEIAHPVNVVHLSMERGYGKQCHLTVNKSQKIAFWKQEAVILNCIFHNETMAEQPKSKIRKEVHIIEFHSIPSGSLGANASAKPVVTLHLKARRPLKNVQVSIIIKTDLEIIFKVKMGSPSGRISIHTNQEISNDAVHKQLLAVSAENFESMSSQELYDWTKLYHGQPLTFSKIFEANVIEIVIGSEVPSSDVMDGPPSPLPTQPHDLANNVIVVCHEEFFTVSISMKDNLLSCDWLTLSDRMCRAQSNSTHCILDSKYGQCRACVKNGIVNTGETCYGDDGGRYKNEILIHDANNKTNENEAPPYSIPLDCSASSVSVNNGSKDNNNNDDINHNTDTKDVYFKLLVVQVQGQDPRKYFVEAVIEPEGSMIAIVEDCQLESTTPRKTVRIRHIVKERCLMGYAEWLRFPTKENPQPVVFSFILDDNIVDSEGGDHDRNEGSKFWKVVCRVFPCFILENMSASDIPQCSSEDYNKCEHESFPALRPSSSSSLNRLLVNVSSHPLPYHNDQSEHLKRGQVDEEERHRLLFQLVSGREGGMDSKACPKGHQHKGEYVTMEIGIIVSFFAFLIGIIFMSALWFICAKTRPKKLIGSKHLRSPDTSGESTPSSTSPITICQIKRSK